MRLLKWVDCIFNYQCFKALFLNIIALSCFVQLSNLLTIYPKHFCQLIQLYCNLSSIMLNLRFFTQLSQCCKIVWNKETENRLTVYHDISHLDVTCNEANATITVQIRSSKVDLLHDWFWKKCISTVNSLNSANKRKMQVSKVTTNFSVYSSWYDRLCWFFILLFQ